MILSYQDITRQYDAELHANAEWSVYILPRGVPYFNTYIPPQLSPYLNEDQILQHIVNYCFIFDNDSVVVNLAVRLMLQRVHFTSVDDFTFSNIVNKALSNYLDIGFVPNTIAKSVRNPYYRFGSVDKSEKKLIRQEHRRKLRSMITSKAWETPLTELLEDYNLTDGLLTRDYIYDTLKITRRHLEELFANSKDLKQMFDLIRTNSLTTKNYRNESRNDFTYGEPTPEII